mmetsp:Transcript_48309/g.122592  ORF Transcript_48309/g.122592 Transcript_48309/m.122592 type:complete len:201 (-) Transcript_48309:476-1078(-)
MPFACQSQQRPSLSYMHHSRVKLPALICASSSPPPFRATRPSRPSASYRRPGPPPPPLPNWVGPLWLGRPSWAWPRAHTRSGTAPCYPSNARDPTAPQTCPHWASRRHPRCLPDAGAWARRARSAKATAWPKAASSCPPCPSSPSCPFSSSSSFSRHDCRWPHAWPRSEASAPAWGSSCRACPSGASPGRRARRSATRCA